MAELSTQERLQPALLDRLTDDEPENPQESRERRVVNITKLRQSVLRDISWLLNSSQMSRDDSLDDYPFVAESVLNYGVPNFAGLMTEAVSDTVLTKAIQDAIRRFEPRLTRDSIKVRLKGSHLDRGHNSLNIEIEAELWAQPVPLRLFMKTEVDIEVGTVRLTERSGPGRN